MRQCLSGLIVNNVWFLCVKQVLDFTNFARCVCRKGEGMFCDKLFAVQELI